MRPQLNNLMDPSDENVKKYEKIIFRSAQKLLQYYGINDITLYDDLISIGYNIMLSCFKNYNPNNKSKTKFSTYLYTSVNLKQMNFLRNYLEKQNKLVYFEEQIQESEEDRNQSNDKSTLFIDHNQSNKFDSISNSTIAENIFNLRYGVNSYPHTWEEIKSLYPQYSIDEIKYTISIIKEKYKEDYATID